MKDKLLDLCESAIDVYIGLAPFTFPFTAIIFTGIIWNIWGW